MDNKSFNYFCSECNIFVETNIISQGNGKFLNTQGLEINHDNLDELFYGDVYYISLCNKCEQPFLIVEHCISGGVDEIISETLLYPKPTKVETKDLPKRVQSSYQDASKSFGSPLSSVRL